MPFSDYRYPEVLKDLGLVEVPNHDLFPGIRPLRPEPGFEAAYSVSSKLGALAHTEASRSTWMVGPLLADLWGRYASTVNLIAGVEFAGDVPNGLNGYVDFLFCRGPQRFVVSPPVLLIFEAKRDSIPDGLGQAVAAMVGAQRYNRREGVEIDPIYGCVTTGSLWRFLRLKGTELTVDLQEYSHGDVEKILGIIAHILGPFPSAA